MHIDDMPFNTSPKLIGAIVIVSLVLFEIIVTLHFLPSLDTFTNQERTNGKFAISQNGRTYSSWFNGHPVAKAAGAFGAGGSFGADQGIPEDIELNVSIAKVPCLFGTVWVATEISSDSHIFFNNTPSECVNLWHSVTFGEVIAYTGVALIIYMFALALF